MDGTHVAIDRADALTSLNTGSVMPSLESKKAEMIGSPFADLDDLDLDSSNADRADNAHRLKKREALLALYQSKPMCHSYKAVKAKALDAKHCQDSDPEEDQTCLTLPKSC